MERGYLLNPKPWKDAVCLSLLCVADSMTSTMPVFHAAVIIWVSNVSLVWRRLVSPRSPRSLWLSCGLLSCLGEPITAG
jgi:hypothetical protein